MNRSNQAHIANGSRSVHTPLRPLGTNYNDGSAPEYISPQISSTSLANDGFKPSDRFVSRTPSPTPSEVEALKEKELDYRKFLTKEFWFKKQTIIRVIIIAALIALIVLFDHYKVQIVNALQPVSNTIKSWPGGWLIPVAILVVISFPPLFGHELIALLCGVTFGFWLGFGIVALGTILGEAANFFVFRFFCRARGEKYELTNITYGCMAMILREGGFLVAVLIRYSFLPGHLITTVFATCGINFWIYLAACVLSLPKQASIVIIGSTILEAANGSESKKDKIAHAVVIAITVSASIFAARYIRRKTAEIKPQVVYNRRKYRQRKLEEQMRGIEHGGNVDRSNPAIESGSALRIPIPQRPLSTQPTINANVGQDTNGFYPPPQPPAYYPPPSGPSPSQNYVRR